LVLASMQPLLLSTLLLLLLSPATVALSQASH
jgi:hypothetical protein